MNRSYYYSPTYWKQADDGLTAHIYEHIIAHYIEMYMRERGCQLVTDYDMWAKTYGRMCLLETRFQTKSAQKDFEKAIKLTSKLVISDSMIDNAVNECGIEYRRLVLKTEDSFSGALNRLATIPWDITENLSYDKAESLSSVNTQFKNEHIRYASRSPRKFEEVILEYALDEKIFASNPPLKALAVLVVQTIALNQSAFLATQLQMYDDGDEWDEGAARVAYRVHVSFTSESLPSQQKMRQIFNANQTAILNAGLADKIYQLIQDNYAQENQQYFSLQTMNNITGGIVIGGAGWQQVGTRENINLLLRELEVRFL